MRIRTVLILLLASTGCGDDPPTVPSPVSLPSEMRIDSVTPVVGSTVIPTGVVIQGNGFTLATTVSVGDTVLQASVTSQQRLAVLIPAQPPGVYALVVRNPDGRSVQFETGFRFQADLPTDPISVRVTGQLLAGSSDVPVGGATMRLPHNLQLPRPSITTDDDGRFTLTGLIPRPVGRLYVEVTWHGLYSWTFESPEGSTDQAVLRLPGVLGIRAGGMLRGEIVRGADQIPCTFESVPCLHLVVGGPPGTLIDLELIPENGQTVGLILDEEFLAPRSYPTRLTVPPRPMWIMGTFGPFTLKAHHVESQAGR